MPVVTQPPFVGRTAERRMFFQQVLTPDEPAVHLIGVWGPPGAGTSALLARWREDAGATPDHGGCLTAFADGRAGSPLQVMRAYAAQLRAAGAPLVAFEDLLNHLMAASWSAFSVEQQAAQTLLVRQVQDLARSRHARGVPLIGGMYEATSRTTRDTVLLQHPALQLQNGQPFQAWQAALTHAFLDDLTWLATRPVQPARPRGPRIILFLDEVTGASNELLTWVRAQVLPATIGTQIVLVLAGSALLDRLLPDLLGVTVLSLQPFAEDETRLFLAVYGIADPTRGLTSTPWRMRIERWPWLPISQKQECCAAWCTRRWTKPDEGSARSIIAWRTTPVIRMLSFCKGWPIVCSASTIKPWLPLAERWFSPQRTHGSLPDEVMCIWNGETWSRPWLTWSAVGNSIHMMGARTGLLLAWARLRRGEPGDEISAWLEMVATRSEEPDSARICHGIALLLRQQFEGARAAFDQVLKLHPEQREATFWKGLACMFLQRDEEALTALEQIRSAAIPLPAVLFTPLRRVAAVRPAFYQQQLLPLLQTEGPHSSAV